MSKLACTCGNVIRDQADHLPHKGQILKDQDREAFLEEVASEVASYVAAVRSNGVESWLQQHPWCGNASEESILRRLLSVIWLKYRVDVYECPECGRLWVQESTESKRFVPFIREEPGTRVLTSEFFCTPAG